MKADATFQLDASIKAAGNGPLGKGVHGAIPLLLQFSSRDFLVRPGQPLKFKVILSVSRGEI